MNYLLVMPRVVDKIGEWYQFPLGICYISASMKAGGFNVFTLNLNNEYGKVNDLLRAEIIKNNIDVILTGGLIFQFPVINEIVRLSKQINPNIIVIIGGGVITAAPVPSMTAFELTDFGVIGEGEITICELCSALENGQDVGSVKGIIYPPPPHSEVQCISVQSLQQNMNTELFNDGKEKMCFIETDARPYNNDLDALPFPDYSGFGIEKILSKTPSTLSMNERGAISILTSRSCPFLCTFCFHTTGNHYRMRSLDNVFSEIDYLIKIYNLKYLSIVDESFGSNKQRVKEFCERIKVYGVKYRVQFRVTDMTKEIAEALKSSDCDCVCFGMESADNIILKSMKKGITIEQIEEAIKICDDAGLSISGGFIFGDIEETLVSAKRTLKWWTDHKEYGFVLNFITTYPGTYLYRYALKKGIIRDEVKFIKDGCPMINVSKLTNTDIEWLAEQINNLQGRQLAEPSNISNIVFDCMDGTISFDFKCEKCEKHNHVEKVRIFVSRNIANCKLCGKVYAVPFPDIVITLIDKNIEKLLTQNTKIAIWPMTERFSFCFDRLHSLKNDSVYLIDSSKLKQNSKLSGKDINNPKIILQKNIEIVIIPPTPHLSAIEAQIKGQFKNVKQIINLEYLCKENVYYE